MQNGRASSRQRLRKRVGEQIVSSIKENVTLDDVQRIAKSLNDELTIVGTKPCNDTTNPWSWFDDIRCINLEERTDRRISSTAVFDKLGIPVNYFTAQRSPNGGLQGCFESHIKVITEAYEKGHENIMIFEDDILPTSAYTPERIRDIISFLKTNQDWDLFFFGALPDIMRTTTDFAGKFGSANIFKGRYLLAHAYAVSSRYMKKVHDMKFAHVPIDVVYSYTPNGYAILPSVFDQDGSPSGIEGHNNSSTRNYRDELANVCARAFGVPLEPACIVLTVGFFILLVIALIQPPGMIYWILLLIAVLIVILLLIYMNGLTYA